ncbi:MULTISPECIES: hypothetical protein [Streptomyces]|uniref:Uncharacterized protein n=1 Tax=Streptomyces sudanensis TaxID=436397 RepID=A0ABY4TCA6_9ACTN|nr:MULTISPECIES: hypothetical protein [Streptomyces]MCP9958492.1 hypothetical protein [Streptomyces sudanensis]MCP9987607.1 hypothetical protein [Streptomyces sudanensis]MCQ0000997.1 hypothetical protein [Streptomyces sudanensis]URN16587.1 hypothetical protein MW084_12275 [Streptomyces sudanensis]
MTGTQGHAPAFPSLSAEQVAALPLETLARSVAVDLLAPGGGSPSVRNWVRGIRRDLRKNSEAMRAISEAVAWLRHRMILVDDLGVGAEGDWVVLSRQGARWLRGGALPHDTTG